MREYITQYKCPHCELVAIYEWEIEMHVKWCAFDADICNRLEESRWAKNKLADLKKSHSFSRLEDGTVEAHHKRAYLKKLQTLEESVSVAIKELKIIITADELEKQ